MQITLSAPHFRFPTAAALASPVARSLLARTLERLEGGRLRVEENGSEWVYGDLASGVLEATITIQDPRAWASLVFGGTIGAGEAYMAGHWNSDHLATAIQIFAQNVALMLELDAGLDRVIAPFRGVVHRLRRNTKVGSRRNISRHYDLGNSFFELFLDETMSYSSAIFPRRGASLEEASVHKMQHVLNKLEVKPGERLLEIGSGWGGLAVMAAEQYGAQVTATTVSQEQFMFMQDLVRRKRLQDRIEVLMIDYRDIRGTYDKLVSIEMIEAVGHEFLKDFFRQCSDRLTPSGLALIQCITLPDDQYERARKGVDFIKHFIFPGSQVLSVSALTEASRNASDFRLVHLEEISPHYAQTLALWRTRFLANVDKVKQLGFPETFVRMWDFYLAYCEGSFRARYNSVVQCLFAKPNFRLAEPL
jgi:cyclopropane-fatty-acyl-phospholipid synthase